MKSISILATISHQSALLDAFVRVAEVWSRCFGLATPRNIVASWEERRRFRWELERMAKDNPHLIDDIGLTRRQVEEEIAKPFWRG